MREVARIHQSVCNQLQHVVDAKYAKKGDAEFMTKLEIMVEIEDALHRLEGIRE